MGKVKRNTLAFIAQIIAIIGAIYMFLGGLSQFLNFAVPGSNPIISTFAGTLGGIIAIILAIVVIVFEIDYVVLPSHLIRGIIYIIFFFFTPAGWLILLAGILYIIAEYVK